MTPGIYLRRRREAAGLTIGDVIMLITPNEAAWGLAFVHTALIEADLRMPTISEIDTLRFAFPFDHYVFRQLLGRLDPAPEICRACGCSALDACATETSGPCAWANPAHDLCTTCAIAGAFTEENDRASCRCPS